MSPLLCPLAAVLRRSFSRDDVERMVGPRGRVVPPMRTAALAAAARQAVELQVRQVADLGSGVAAGIDARDGCSGREARFEEQPEAKAV